ncbi:hypothetical protein [Candidatus Poriferisocius sp.]|uniref:hypothetical protein n=1 Tax=Candidatus Poriferisocius sp. TaxID=3101276 RepID=UPI003B5AAA7D
MNALRRRGLGVLTAAVMVAAGCGGSGGGDEVSCVLSPGNDKYCLVEDPAGGGGGLKRLRALRDITTLENGQPVLVAQRGDLGGWVEGEENLSAEGSAWVAGDAKVLDDARVEGDALVTGLAEVSGGAVVRDRAQVSGRVQVFGDAQVSDQARVMDAAVVCSDAEVYGQAVVEDEAVVCGWVPRAFALWGGDAAGDGPNAAGMVAWVDGWSEMVMELVQYRAGQGGTGAHLFGEAVVSGRAWVLDQARVFGEAEILDQARVYEHAQVFGYSRVSDDASVYGSALVFSSADSEYVSGMSEGGEKLFSPAFSASDVAREWETDSRAAGRFWTLPIEGIRHLLKDFEIPAKDRKNLPDVRSQSHVDVTQQVTHVSDRASVFGQGRVWGGSSVLGNARVEGWVSGGSIVVSRVCHDFWTNRLINSSNAACRGW